MALGFFAGCSLIPHYQRPKAPVASQWPDGAAEKGMAAASEISWRTFFSDARLKKLVELALANNRDLRIALLNVEQTRAQYRIFNYALLPSIDGQAHMLREHDVSSGGTYTTNSRYEATLDASYEVDLFGRIRSLKAQAVEQYLATKEAGRSAQITLIAEVAIQYLNACALDEEVALSQQTLKAVEAYHELIKNSYDLGNTSALDLHSAESQMQNARANIASYRRQRMQADNALALLIGQPLPKDLPPAPPLTAQPLLTDLSPGAPSDLLELRPDIIAAEHQLKAANANIGAVRANFFPKITLTGAAGTASVKLAELFMPGSGIWNFSPQVSIPIFDRNANAANLDVAHTQKSIQVAQYEKTIQTAFREVADALQARGTYNDQLNAQQALVKAQDARYQLADARYRNGVDSYLTVLTAQQDLYAAQQSLILVEFARLSNLISLYKALGGGWQ